MILFNTITTLMRCYGNLTLAFMNWPAVKLVLLYVTSLRVGKPVDDVR